METIFLILGIGLISTVIFAYRIIETKYGYIQAERLRILQSLLFILIIIVHGSITLGITNISIFICISFFISGLFEIIGVNTGYIFGSYKYTDRACPLPSILGVPLCYPLAWVGLTYAGFWTGLLLFKDVPTGIIHFDWQLILGISVLVTLLDVISDPIAVHEGRWTWHRPGKFYNVPLTNFVGWLFTALVILTVFKYSAPQMNPVAASPTLTYLPVMGYIIFAGAGARVCFERRLKIPAYIGVITAVVILAVSLLKLYF